VFAVKVLFLDVDGVLNNFDLIRANGFDYIDDAMVRVLAGVAKQTGADIVLSSFWRLDPHDRSLVDAALKRHGMFVSDRTPSMPGPRAGEISAWLRMNPEVERYAILDDDEEAGIGMESSFFLTDAEVGITAKIADAVVSHLNWGDDD
jgi:hypothetical protein